jgi:cell wall-associated NlpC family hydrolase
LLQALISSPIVLKRGIKVAASAGGCALVVGLSLAGPALHGLNQSSNNNLNICGALPVGTALPDGRALNSQQAANAAIITSTAQSYGAGQAGAVDAVTAAFTESRLINVPFGDRDSLGLFQERPSQGWGTPQQIMDPVYATQQFLKRLVALPGWQSLSPAVAAQAVERSAFPDRYQMWVQPAMQLVAGLIGTGACSNADAGGGTSVPALPVGFTLPVATPAPVVTAIKYALAQLGKPYVWGGIGPDGFDCSGLTMQAYHAAGISIPRTTYTQVYAGQAVYDPTQLAPGDLIFTIGADPGPGGLPGHVGMVIGTGLVIDAPHTGATVRVSTLSSWTPTIVVMRRIVPL